MSETGPLSRMTASRPDCERTEVDGVPVFWSEHGGELRAALVFRTGVIDEGVPQRGLTHLVEHLALSQVDDRLVHGWNGFVDMVRTVFFASGEPEEVTSFLEHVCSTLSDLPVERLALEQGVLRAEAMNYSAGTHGDLLTARYGLRGPGAVVIREFGLEHASAAAVADWAKRFSKGNAALWISGPPPDGIRLPLPAGERIPVPVLPAAIIDGPTYTVGRPGGAALAVVADPEAPLQLAFTVLERRLRRRLRTAEGVSYAVNWGLQQIGVHDAQVLLSVDATDGRGPDAWRGLREEVDRLATDGPDDDEVRHAASLARRQMSGEDAILGYLDRTVVRELTGRPHARRSDYGRALDECSAASVRSALAVAIAEAIYQTPPDAPRPRDLTMLPASSSHVVVGPRFGPAQPGGDGVLIFGPDGVSAEGPAGRSTVLVRDCVAVLRWADGNRAALGGDGFIVNVDPSLWEQPRRLVSMFDQTFLRVPSVTAGRRRRAPSRRPFRPRELSHREVVGTAVILVVVMRVFRLWGDTPGLIAAAAVFVGAAMWLRSRRAREPADWGVQLWDDTTSMDWSTWPPDVPTSQAYVCCGLLLGWFVSRDLVSDWFRSESGPDLDDFLAGKLTGPQLYQRWDGILTTDMLNDEGRSFARFYLREPHRRGTRGFDRDYSKLAAGLRSPYHVPDTAESAAKLAALADKRLENWRRFRVFWSGIEPIRSLGRRSR